jgi:hypothetical protein
VYLIDECVVTKCDPINAYPLIAHLEHGITVVSKINADGM